MQLCHRFFSLAGLALLASVSFGNAQPARAADADAEDEKLAIVDKVGGMGSATASSANGSNWELAAGDAVAEGETITVGPGTLVDLRLADGSMLRLAPDTKFKVQKIDAPGAGPMHWFFRLLGGTVSGTVRTENEAGEVKLRIDSAAASMGVRGTEFTFGIDDATGESVLETHSGEVLLAGAGVDVATAPETAKVAKGQISSVPRGERRALAPIAAAEGRGTRYQKMAGFFSRADSLRARPLELRPRLREMKPAERQQLRREIQQKRQERKLGGARRFGGEGGPAPGQKPDAFRGEGKSMKPKMNGAGGGLAPRTSAPKMPAAGGLAPRVSSPMANSPAAKPPAAMAPQRNGQVSAPLMRQARPMQSPPIAPRRVERSAPAQPVRPQGNRKK